MKIDQTTIKRLEKLAKLNLSKTERATLLQDLNKIVTMVDKLAQIDTTGVEPLRYLSQEPNHFREDLVNNDNSQATVLKNAPNSDGQYFRVPKFVK